MLGIGAKGRFDKNREVCKRENRNRKIETVGQGDRLSISSMGEKKDKHCVTVTTTLITGGKGEG